MKGITFTLALGSYGGFYAHVHKTNWRVCLGWVAFTIYFVDLENYIEILIREKHNL